MGCVSSKILVKSASFREELRRSMRKRTNSVEDVIIAKNGGDQFVALICSANSTVARKLKEQPPAQEPTDCKVSPEIKNSDSTEAKGPEKNDVEIINTWELLAGLEDQDNDEEEHRHSNDTRKPANTLLAVEQEKEETDDTAEEDRLKRSESEKKGSKRKAMAKELVALKVPSFEFKKTGSLRDWLVQGGGQVFSPGSYITPKFGNYASPGANDGDGDAAFHPELVAHFEEAMERLTTEEESILQEIMENLDQGGGDEDISRAESSKSQHGRDAGAQFSFSKPTDISLDKF